MPILKNERYENFEYKTPRDAFRGVPLQRFPWLLEEKTIFTMAGRLNWRIQVYCLGTTPSGFGAKLNLGLRATAELKAESAHKIAFPDTQNQRVETLFGGSEFSIQDELEKTFEGRLEDLPKFGDALLKQMVEKLSTDWTSDKIQAQLRGRMRDSSPGGFGHRWQT